MATTLRSGQDENEAMSSKDSSRDDKQSTPAHLNRVATVKSLLDPIALRTYSSPPPLTTSFPSNNAQSNTAVTKFAPIELNRPPSIGSHRSIRWNDGGQSNSRRQSREVDPLYTGGHMRGSYFPNPDLAIGSSSNDGTSKGAHQQSSNSSVVNDGGPGASNGRRQSLEYSTGEDTETPTGARRAGFFSKLIALGHTATHGRSLSGWTLDSPDEPPTAMTPGGAHFQFTPGTVDEDQEEDDLEDTRRTDGTQRRRSFSPGSGPGAGESRTAPTTPRTGPRRRATMTDIPEESLDRRRPSSSHAQYGRGPPSFRRFAAFDYFRNAESGGEVQSPGGHHTSASVAKWRALKAGIKMIGKGKKEESKVDREKSAELMAELAAATPAAVILASMFQRDEHGNKRIPILLEQLKVRIVDSKPPAKGSSRYHTTFKIELEYGSGLTRMKWVIHREFRDFVNLHSRYRLADISNTTFGGKEAYKLPRFPRATIPYLRGVRGLGSDEEDADGEGSGLEDGRPEDGSTTTSRVQSYFPPDTPGPFSMAGGMPQTPMTPPPASPRLSNPFRRKHSTPGTPIEGPAGLFHGDMAVTATAAGIGALVGAVGGGNSTIAPLTSRRSDTFALRQRQKLEHYLQGLIRIMIFRPDSNRLCKFLELSALGVRLAAENSHHGKEGYLVIRSSKGSDFKRGFTPDLLTNRHRPKWFLVRHSYIVCVDSPEEMNIYDVFLVDSMFEVDAHRFLRKKAKGISPSSNPAHPQHHSFNLKNSERQIKVLAKNERQLNQFVESIKYMKENTPWSKANRLGSFAPVRKNVTAQWLVDGRDYMWNVSRAIMMAKDVIYIHDWWLSPELYLRRPAAMSQKWRLDRLLQKKASEGVKIFVIVYRNIGAAIPIDSAYTKYSLLDLHPNVFVQRSPNQIRQNTFFWAHHEKILVVDHMVAFVGGIDLCFGRWDTPQHSLRDDKPTGFDENAPGGEEKYQLWPGKDYSNPRVLDFYELDKPYDEMYDRCKVPRMPWHDISMQLVGQPARDLTRHFVQRWNYLLRQRKPSRPTPVLLPPPDLTDVELESLGVEGTCEVQILRSSCAWSMGTPYETEHSILNAYLKSIETSEHFVYIENQFFITSCEWEGTTIENSIGDALVERIIRAHKNDEDWRAIIVLPLMPGFQNSVDSQDGTSVRLIMQMQYRSISRGESSIFGKLRAYGIDPEDFIQFYGLRNWGKIGPEDALVTEQVYIHAKCMVVDDRVAIIGSANINERSMLGNRDSEVAAIVRDTETIMSTMAGRPFRVGKFPHTLRLRLMREHLGLDVDEIMTEERKAESAKMEMEWEEQVKQWQNEKEDDENSTVPTEHTRNGPKVDGSAEVIEDQEVSTPRASKYRMTPTAVKKDDAVLRAEELLSFNHDVDWEQENSPYTKSKKKESSDARVSENPKHRKDVAGLGPDNMQSKEEAKKKRRELGFKHYLGNRESKHGIAKALPPWETRSQQSSTYSPTTTPNRPTTSGGLSPTPRPGTATETITTRSSSRATNTSESGLGNGDLPPPIPARLNSIEMGLPLLSTLPPLPQVSDAEIGGPIGPRPVSHGSTTPNTFLQELNLPKVEPDMFVDPLNDSFYLDVWHQAAQNNTKLFRDVFRCMPDNEVKTWKEYKEYAAYQERFSQAQMGSKGNLRRQQEAQGKTGPPGTATSSTGGNGGITGTFGSISETLNEKAQHLHVPHLHHGDNNLGQGSVREWASPSAQSVEEKEKTERGNDNAASGEPLHQVSSTTSLPCSVTFSEKNAPHRDNHSFLESLKPGSPRSQDTASTKPPNSRGTQDVSFNEKQDSTAVEVGPTTTNLSSGTGITAYGAQGTGTTTSPQPQPSVRRRRRNTRGSRREFHANDDLIQKDVAEELLERVQGHLVIWPYDWLIKAEDAGNWLYSIDQLAPIEIYN